jgi:hypothetical protein
MASSLLMTASSTRFKATATKGMGFLLNSEDRNTDFNENMFVSVVAAVPLLKNVLPMTTSMRLLPPPAAHALRCNHDKTAKAPDKEDLAGQQLSSPWIEFDPLLQRTASTTALNALMTQSHAI